jgi:hypothetical protein
MGGTSEICGPEAQQLINGNNNMLSGLISVGQ